MSLLPIAVDEMAWSIEAGLRVIGPIKNNILDPCCLSTLNRLVDRERESKRERERERSFREIQNLRSQQQQDSSAVVLREGPQTPHELTHPTGL